MDIASVISFFWLRPWVFIYKTPVYLREFSSKQCILFWVFFGIKMQVFTTRFDFCLRTEIQKCGQFYTVALGEMTYLFVAGYKCTNFAWKQKFWVLIFGQKNYGNTDVFNPQKTLYILVIAKMPTTLKPTLKPVILNILLFDLSVFCAR